VLVRFEVPNQLNSAKSVRTNASGASLRRCHDWFSMKRVATRMKVPPRSVSGSRSIDQEPARGREHVRVDGELVVLVEGWIREDRREGPTRDVARVGAGADDVARAVVDRVAVVGVDEPAEDAVVEVLVVLGAC
jgi:hypothetical protein